MVLWWSVDRMYASKMINDLNSVRLVMPKFHQALNYMLRNKGNLWTDASLIANIFCMCLQFIWITLPLHLFQTVTSRIKLTWAFNRIGISCGILIILQLNRIMLLSVCYMVKWFIYTSTSTIRVKPKNLAICRYLIFLAFFTLVLIFPLL